MKPDFAYSTTFTLDKTYFAECYQESVTINHSWQSYAKAIFFTLFGAFLVLLTEINAYVAWFLFALGIVEALSVYYQKPWWVARQMLSKASKSEVTLTINEQGIKSHSFYIDETILWSDISAVEKTTQGWVVQHAKGKNYLSSAFLSDKVTAFFELFMIQLKSDEQSIATK